MKNILTNIPNNLESEVLERLVDAENVQIERIISLGHRSPDTGWFDQETNEWVMVLKGEAVLLFEEGTTKNLKPGDYLNIPAHTKHKVEWTEPDSETIWLAVHY
ncbi:MAG: cupin domain-containing protein [Proteobacteria bacterium]|nr:cupin domain-containing protein [Pseudomonadota bacterium]